MKKCMYLLLLAVMTIFSNQQASAQNAAEARKVLDKTAAIVGRSGGASANFTMSSGKYGNTSGTIAIKGNKFHATTPQAVVWYNGKTQWSYMKKTDEVNISNPNEAQQMSMNPYKFITMYKSGYTLSMKNVGGNKEIHMVAQNKGRSIPELYITVNSSYLPTQIKMRQGSHWSTIKISNFKAKNLSDATFVFNAKDYPSAEMVDLR